MKIKTNPVFDALIEHASRSGEDLEQVVVGALASIRKIVAEEDDLERMAQIFITGEYIPHRANDRSDIDKFGQIMADGLVERTDEPKSP